MFVRTSRQFTGAGTVSAVFINNRRYGLRPDGHPEDATMDPRSRRRNLAMPVEQPGISRAPPVKPMRIDDFEPALVDFTEEYAHLIEQFGQTCPADNGENYK
jgi:hypothetical protein